MKRIARFEKVSIERFKKDYMDSFSITEEETMTVYENLKKPHRATVGSAGYDFYSPCSVRIDPGESKLIFTDVLTGERSSLAV